MAGIPGRRKKRPERRREKELGDCSLLSDWCRHLENIGTMHACTGTLRHMHPDYLEDASRAWLVREFDDGEGSVENSGLKSSQTPTKRNLNNRLFRGCENDIEEQIKLLFLHILLYQRTSVTLTSESVTMQKNLHIHMCRVKERNTI